MTEDEAKTKWCPIYRVATSGGGGGSTFETDNRPRDGIAPPEGSPKDAPWFPGPNINPWACCIGSACMAWREVTVEKRVLKDGTEPKPRQVYLAADVAKINTHVIGGYCGLVGKP